MDRKLGGLHPSDLIILAGRPSMGKTSLATNIAFNIAKAYKKGERPDGSIGTIDGGVVGFFSLEMSAEQLATRILSEQAEVASEKLRRGEMEEEEFRRVVEASRQLASMPLYIDDTPASRDFHPRRPCAQAEAEIRAGCALYRLSPARPCRFRQGKPGE